MNKLHKVEVVTVPKHRALKAYREVEANFHVFLT